jgi:predicted kinase
MVRAHVEAARGHPEPSARYLQFAMDYLRPAPALVMAIGGLQGTGKSTLARDLAPELGAAPGAVVLRSDEIRKRQHGVAPEHRLPQTAYSDQANLAVEAELARAAAELAGGGHAVIGDATFMDPALRAAFARAAGATPFLGVVLHAPMAVLEARLAARKGDASDADVAVLRRAAAADPGPGSWLPVDATDREAALSAIREAVRRIAPKAAAPATTC